MSGGLVLWTIYNRPLDYPGGFVVVPWTTGPRVASRGNPLYAATLEEARALVPPGLYRMDRDPNDDPAIAETWV